MLNGISLTVNRRDIYGFLGPNGSGKTTTLRVLLGLLPLDGGRAVVLGLDPAEAGPALRQRVNALPESHGLYGWVSSERYLKFFGDLYGMDFTRKAC